MSLPNIEILPIIFDCTLPILKQEVKFNPYLVEDEKGFLSAAKSNDMKSLIENYDAVLKKRLITDVDLENMFLIDYLYLCIMLKCKSKDEELSVILKKCDKCGKKNAKFNIDIINSIKIENTYNIKTSVKIDDNLTLHLAPLKRDFIFVSDDLKKFDNLSEDERELEVYKHVIAYSIDMFVYKNEPYKKFDIDYILGIISDLHIIKLKKIFKKLSTMPKTYLEIEMECPQCHDKIKYSAENFLKYLK